MGRPLHLLVCSIATGIALAEDTLHVQWTTDNQEKWGTGSFGPDGPWQAVVVHVGSKQEYGAMWPTGGGTSIVVTSEVEAGGNYSISESTTAAFDDTASSIQDDWYGVGWGVDMFTQGFNGYDEVGLGALSGTSSPRINASLDAATRWLYNVNWGENYTDPVGVLGLGQPLYSRSVDTSDLPQSMLESFKREGHIGSKTFGMHIGSVPFEQPGSLVLGGYEKNRALGPVGVFDYDVDDITPLPYMFLIDIIMGHEVGESPYTFPEIDKGSVFGGIDPEDNDFESAERFSRRLGRKPNTTVVVVPHAAAPYIALPYGSFDKLTDRLPLDWDDIVGLWMWDTTDPTYTKIVQSSAYVAFVFADRTDTNITIKVPFQLLNLTLVPPLSETTRLNRTQYFPLKSYTGGSYWSFGRAFLQAAFFGFDLENKVTYLAQAPGPAMAEAETVTIKAGELIKETNSIEQFVTSWLPHWTVINKDGTSSPGKDFVPPSSNKDDTKDKAGDSQERNSGGGGGGLGTGAVVGIAIGVIAVGLAIGGFFLHRFFKRRTERLPAAAAVANDGQSNKEREWAKSHDGQVEMDAEAKVTELAIPKMAHEMESPHRRHEAGIPVNLHGTHHGFDGQVHYVELPAEHYGDRGADVNTEGRR